MDCHNCDAWLVENQFEYCCPECAAEHKETLLAAEQRSKSMGIIDSNGTAVFHQEPKTPDQIVSNLMHQFRIRG